MTWRAKETTERESRYKSYSDMLISRHIISQVVANYTTARCVW